MSPSEWLSFGAREYQMGPLELEAPARSFSGWHYGFRLADTGGFESLVELALDLRWSWNHAADELWRQLDPALWDLTHNPFVILQTLSRDRCRSKRQARTYRFDDVGQICDVGV